MTRPDNGSWKGNLSEQNLAKAILLCERFFRAIGNTNYYQKEPRKWNKTSASFLPDASVRADATWILLLFSQPAWCPEPGRPQIVPLCNFKLSHFPFGIDLCCISPVAFLAKSTAWISRSYISFDWVYHMLFLQINFRNSQCSITCNQLGLLPWLVSEP